MDFRLCFPWPNNFTTNFDEDGPRKGSWSTAIRRVINSQQTEIKKADALSKHWVHNEKQNCCKTKQSSLVFCLFNWNNNTLQFLAFCCYRFCCHVLLRVQSSSLAILSALSFCWQLHGIHLSVQRIFATHRGIFWWGAGWYWGFWWFLLLSAVFAFWISVIPHVIRHWPTYNATVKQTNKQTNKQRYTINL